MSEQTLVNQIRFQSRWRDAVGLVLDSLGKKFTGLQILNERLETDIFNGEAEYAVYMTVSGPAPTLRLGEDRKMRFLCVLMAAGERWITRGPIGIQIPDSWRERGPDQNQFCDHCGANLQLAKMVFMFDIEDTPKRTSKRIPVAVEETCLDMFSEKHGYPDGGFREYALLLGSATGVTREKSPSVAIGDYLAEVAAESRIGAWVSASKAQETGIPPTSWLAWRSLVGQKPTSKLSALKAPTQAPRVPLKTDFDAVEAALAWVRDDAFVAREGLTDYEYNLRAICSLDQITYDMTPMAASLLASYGYSLKMADFGPGEFIGAVGDIVETTLRYVSSETKPGRRGMFTLHTYMDPKGNRLVQFTAPYVKGGRMEGGRMEEGRVYKVKARVVKHDTFREMKSTTIADIEVLGEASSRMFIMGRRAAG